MIKEMESLVNECLIQHEGGERFFDAIDEKLRNDNLLITMIIGKVMENEKFDYLIVSGQFGKVLKNFCCNHIGESFSNNIIVVNGGLRNGNEINEFYKEYDINNKKLIFIDDSYYLGRTRDKIKDTITQNGGQLICSYVFYDGSKIKDESVHSFYRYYDHYPITD